ncbi:unnamed protein product [Oikopleura dioica]|uniref:Sodium/hydrogen exchanger n=1 Tax=Oikopleura dioica TaxID=34765 RepID=E4XDW4_OIKDI|nr:unnamed protein product [Oikopleura dioica]
MRLKRYFRNSDCLSDKKVCICITVALLAKILFHYAHNYARRVPECCLLICLGLIAGELFYCVHEVHLAEHLFTTQRFFTFLLPPIMLDAGFFMPKKAFFQNIGTILTYAVIGTMFNAFAIGMTIYGCYLLGLFSDIDEGASKPLGVLECLLFGSIMSAVDPVTVIAVFEEVKVNMVLYISVFGESILNDGVAVVLYQVFESFLEIGDEAITFVNLWRAVIKFSIVAGGGTLMGCVFGYLGSFVFKATKKFRMLEPMFIFINCYTAYLIAELLDLSAILSIIFCAFVMMDRSENEMSAESHVVVKYSLKMMANTAEIIIFIMLGLTSVQEFMTDFAHNWNTGLFVTTLISVTVYRFMSVYGLTWILNQFRAKPIPYNDQFVMSLSGLRGGIAFSLTKVVPPHLLPHIHQMLTTCIGIIFFTSFVQGGSIGPLVEYLKIKNDDDHFDQPHLLNDDEEQKENKEKCDQLEISE